MNVGHGSAARLIHILKGRIPSQCLCCTAGYTRYTRHALGCTVTGEMFCKNAAIIILFLVAWRMDGEAFGSMFHLLVTHLVTRDLLQCVYPRIAHAVRELFFLSPCHFGRQHIGKTFTYNLLLHRLSRAHLILRIQAHRHIQKFFVKEWNSALYPPGSQALVSTQTVVHIEF